MLSVAVLEESPCPRGPIYKSLSLDLKSLSLRDSPWIQHCLCFKVQTVKLLVGSAELIHWISCDNTILLLLIIKVKLFWRTFHVTKYMLCNFCYKLCWIMVTVIKRWFTMFQKCLICQQSWSPLFKRQYIAVSAKKHLKLHTSISPMTEICCYT